MIDLTKDLADAQFPASKQDLVIIAEANEADNELLDQLEQLPDVDFESIEDVESALASKKGFNDPQQSAHSLSQRAKIEERKKELKEKTGKLTEPGKTVAGEPDHRLLENETDAIHSARHMEHGYDGRGEVRTPEMDARLKENRGEIQRNESPKERKRKTWKEYNQA